MEHRAQRLHLPKRQVKKTMMTLPLDQIEFLDSCAAAVGQARSSFLALVIDGFYDEIASFAKGYAARIVEQVALTGEKNKKSLKA